VREEEGRRGGQILFFKFRMGCRKETRGAGRNSLLMVKMVE